AAGDRRAAAVLVLHAAGGVKNEYSGGTPVTGSAGGNGTSSDRAQERFFANTVRQQLRDEIERRLKGDADQMLASFSIWIARDGAIERYELQPSGNAGNDAALRAALDETQRQFRLPPPPQVVAQPLRFRLNVRPQA
ncbi:TonB C-terminal domain-containing protein, partial [Pelomonas sp. KK5]|uniref:TonB C-terminal domain-containing protein n=1 Tax=Pelomonas sp. KK5 TaxID=1855730 RepID=UPI001180AB0E